jgi:hypothetical protein
MWLILLRLDKDIFCSVSPVCVSQAVVKMLFPESTNIFRTSTLTRHINSDGNHPFLSSLLTFSKKINFQFESYMYWNKTHCFGDEVIVHESLCHNTLVNFIHFIHKISKKWPININFQGNPRLCKLLWKCWLKQVLVNQTINYYFS